jgi:cytochrome P450
VEVSRHPEVQQRIQRELQSVVPGAVEHLLPSHLAELAYLECVIKEGMRLWPVAALGSMRLASKDIPYKDFIIPKGSTLMIPFYPLFRTADIQV